MEPIARGFGFRFQDFGFPFWATSAAYSLTAAPSPGDGQSHLRNTL